MTANVMLTKLTQSPPSRGAWIEIGKFGKGYKVCKSPPSRGAWIEIKCQKLEMPCCDVAPLAGGVD